MGPGHHLWGGCWLSFVGGCLCFLAGCGGAVVVGGHWHSWAVTKGSDGDEHGW